jgi:hypothetical protein
MGEVTQLLGSLDGHLYLDSQDVIGVLSGIVDLPDKPDIYTGILIGDDNSVWATESSRPYSIGAVYDKVGYV